MKRSSAAAVALILVASVALADNDTSAPPASLSAQDAGIPVSKLIAIVAKKTGKKFVLDPRVRADVTLIGQDPSSLSYADLLTVFKVHGFAAVEDGGYVQVVPDANVRVMALPTVGDKDVRPASEFVSAVVTVKSVSAAQLVPILRPLMPQYGHLAANPCTNQVMLIDSYSNVRRLEALIHTLDVGSEPYKPGRCDGRDATASK